ncbi:MAG TPA: trigger factor [Blastocatellia bacterium]|nr:trigger factor [Blastocatellia bacterium]
MVPIIQLQDLSDCEKEIVFELAADEVNREFASVYRTLAEQVELPGFRRGKVPVSVLRQRFRRDVQDQVSRRLLARLIEEAVRRFQIRPASEPEVIEASVSEGAPLKMKIRMEVFPSVEVKPYKGLRATKKIVAVTDKDIDAVLHRLQESHAVLVPTDRTEAQAGDVVTVEATAEVLSNDSGETSVLYRDREQELELNPQKLLPDFYNNLIGLRTGESRSFVLSYPADSFPPEFAGRTIRHAVRLLEIRRKDVPPLDDEFARSVDDTVSTLDELREKIRRQLTDRREKEAQEALHQEVLGQLLDQNRFSLPPTVLQVRTQRKAEQMVRILLERGADVEAVEAKTSALVETSRELAERELRAALILEKIADLEGITVSEAEVDAEIARRAARFHYSPADLKRRLTKEGLLDSIRDELRNRKALETVVAHAQVTTEIVEAAERT